MRKSGKCEYTIGVNTRKKKKYLRPEEALAEVERLNNLPNVVKKFIAYKCTTCNFFHVGRSTEDNKKPTTEDYNKAVSHLRIVTKIAPVPIPEIKYDDFDWDNQNKYI